MPTYLDPYRDRSEVAEKVEHEGGILDAIVYGLSVEDMPEDDIELREAWAALKAAYAQLEPLLLRVDDLLYQEE